eukprot:CAMPEP_0197234676 /NCGR_PEP_ID=MMETSP1429-20130617/2372_1 /TAXON_ID=49237 /ORGANISM="Chaetoceros  sp., Strain UNC1202" /LENGTH=154 /DNA_ID=CAMNT_0042693143 /DNA_START=151 /DNA_END=611 /DNA_ORIENTATION=-
MTSNSKFTLSKREQQQDVLHESGKMLKYVRKEVHKLRGKNSQLTHDFNSFKASNQRLIVANASLGTTCDVLRLRGSNDGVISNISIPSLDVGDAAILLEAASEAGQGESVVGTGSTRHAGKGREGRMGFYGSSLVRFVCASSELESVSDDCVGG